MTKLCNTCKRPLTEHIGFECPPEVGLSDSNALVRVQADSLERWELFRTEMMNHQDRLGKLAADFLMLEAFEDAAKCAIKADGIKYALGRMPVIAP